MKKSTRTNFLKGVGLAVGVFAGLAGLYAQNHTLAKDAQAEVAQKINKLVQMIESPRNLKWDFTKEGLGKIYEGSFDCKGKRWKVTYGKNDNPVLTLKSQGKTMTDELADGYVDSTNGNLNMAPRSTFELAVYGEGMFQNQKDVADQGDYIRIVDCIINPKGTKNKNNL